MTQYIEIPQSGNVSFVISNLTFQIRQTLDDMLFLDVENLFAGKRIIFNVPLSKTHSLLKRMKFTSATTIEIEDA